MKVEAASSTLKRSTILYSVGLIYFLFEGFFGGWRVAEEVIYVCHVLIPKLFDNF